MLFQALCAIFFQFPSRPSLLSSLFFPPLTSLDLLTHLKNGSHFSSSHLDFLVLQTLNLTLPICRSPLGLVDFPALALKFFNDRTQLLCAEYLLLMQLHKINAHLGIKLYKFERKFVRIVIYIVIIQALVILSGLRGIGLKIGLKTSWPVPMASTIDTITVQIHPVFLPPFQRLARRRTFSAFRSPLVPHTFRRETWFLCLQAAGIFQFLRQRFCILHKHHRCYLQDLLTSRIVGTRC
mmetsp:Transcript_51293/g.130488  ORF Transcript_51293/g.130488 Transcript_51293/m.130488 type:complete len:238 (-) Transcript_51293:130-843(-)